MKRFDSKSIASVAIVACFILVPACGKKRRAANTPPTPQPVRAATTPPPAPPASTAPAPQQSGMKVGYVEEGVASWYGVPFHGRPAADGEIYDMEAMVAAHRLMPFNTWVRVTNLTNGKTVDVRIIDRGPFVAGRFLDLSKAAARQIDLIGPGTGRVKLEVISAPSDIPSNDFYGVQVGAFAVYANAERTRMEYAERFGVAQLAVKQGPVPLWRVLVGKEKSIQQAQQVADQLRAEHKNVFVVRLDETIPSTPPAATPSASASPLPAP